MNVASTVLEDPEPFIAGRKRELAFVTRHIEVVTAGRATVVLISVEPVNLKKLLLDAIATLAVKGGAIVRRGEASDATGMPPYLPFLEALGQHVRETPRDALHAQTGSLAAILATILPELRQRLGDLPQTYPLPAEQARLRLYEAIGDFLAAIASKRIALLLLDDLQWADPASLELLCHVVRHQPTARLLILGAYREEEVEHNEPFRRAVIELGRLRAVSALTLDPLDEAATHLLAARYLGAPIDPAIGKLLATQSEGNPFVAEELLRMWSETRVLVRPNLRWRLRTSPDGSLPLSIVSAVRQRLSRLTMDVFEVLRIAAIIGRTFDVRLLADTAGEDAEAVDACLRPALLARLLRAQAEESYAFSHDTIRAYLYDSVPVVRRRRLHGIVGKALESRCEHAGPRQLAELAFHFSRSGDRDRGALYAQRAAEHAVRIYAPQDAMTHYQTALNMISPSDPRRASLLLGLGEAAMLAEAEPMAVEANALAQALFEKANEPIWAARAAHRLGHAWARQEAITQAKAAYESAAALLQDHAEADLVRVLVDLGSLLAVSLHDYTAGIAQAQRALELAEPLADKRILAATSRTLGNLLVRGNDLATGVPLLERALALAVAVDDPLEAAECCACLAPAHLWRGSIGESRAVTLRRMSFAERCHDIYQLRHVHAWLAMCDGHQGKVDAMKRQLDQAKTIVDRLTSPEPRAWLLFCRGGAAYLLGDYVEAEAHIQDSLALFGTTGRDALVWYLGLLALVQSAQGKTSAARSSMDELEALLATITPGTMPTATALAYLAETAYRLDDRDRLARYYPLLIVFQGQFQDFLVDRLLGQIELLNGDWDTAENHLAMAAALARHEQLPTELALTMAAQGALALVRDAREGDVRAAACFNLAMELFQNMGNWSEARRLRERIRLLGKRPGSPALPAGLSARQAQVLRFVAAGKSNRAIATELVLSEKTVENHLTSIYSKIGAVNRASATAFAVRHGLA